MFLEFTTNHKISKVDACFNADFLMLIRKPKLCSKYIR